MNRDDIGRFYGDSVESRLRSYLGDCEIKTRGDRRSRISCSGKQVETRLMESMLSECRSLMSGDVSAKAFLCNFLLHFFVMIDLYSEELRGKTIYQERDAMEAEISRLNERIEILETKIKQHRDEIRRKNELIVGRSCVASSKGIDSLALSSLSMNMITGCIYFLMSGDKISYIGQSVNVYQRTRSHLSEGRIDFDSVLFLPCQKEELDPWEAALIRHFDPPYNRKKKFSDVIDLDVALAEVFEAHGQKNNN